MIDYEKGGTLKWQRDIEARLREPEDVYKRQVYYDSMTSEGKMDWQNALTDKNTMFMTDEEGNAVADEMFLRCV